MAIDYARVLWVDINTNFGVDADPELVVDIAAINNSLFNIFNCMVGTRPNEREYGSYLLQQLFEPGDNQTADDIIFGLIQSIERWEPRIFVRRDRTWIRAFPEGGGFDIMVSYQIRRTAKTASYNFKVSL